MSVLVVDADTAQHESMRAILGEHYKLAFVSSMKEALQAIQLSAPDLLVSEIDLADGTGLTLCALVRELPGGSRLPIMLVTSHSSTSDKVAGFQAGADDYVVKPVDSRLFSARLRLLFRLKGIERPRDLHTPQGA
ncbi:MAG TPA: response regulator [Ktedonobacterales bacterium]|nr:response regulator [Ktedonobacterales bacterium]